MSVEEFATHISSSLPVGRSRVRPGRLMVSASQFRPALAVSIVIIVSITFTENARCEVWARRERCGAECESGVADVRTDQMLAKPSGCGGFRPRKLVARGVGVF